MDEGGSVHDKAAPEVAASMRRLLAVIDAGQMSCSKGYRRQLHGAIVVLEGMARCRKSAHGRSSVGHTEGLGDDGQGVEGSSDD